MARWYAPFALFSVVALPSVALAQPMPPGHPAITPPPGRAGFPGSGPFMGRGGEDCAVTALGIAVKDRRTAAQVDVTMRVRGVRGGMCVIRPEAIQVATSRGGPTTRPIGEISIDGKPVKPLSVGDAPGADHLRPWVSHLNANEEHVIDVRYWVEGDVSPQGDVDGPGRVRVELRALGPRVAVGSLVTAHVAVEPSTAARAALWLGNPKTPSRPQTVNAGGTFDGNGAIDKDDYVPIVDWRYDVPPPAAATPTTMKSGLATLEYLRDGLARDLAAALADPKDEKAVAAGWDRAFDVAVSAAKSSDPIVAGMGYRAVAWLASGLSPAATTIHSDKAKGGEGAEVPASVADAVDPAATKFVDATGQKIAPSPVSSRSARVLLPKLAESPDRKKEADAAAKRLAKRLDDGKLAAIDVAAVYTGATQPPPPPVAAPPTARVMTFGPRGPVIPGEGGGAGAAPKRPIASRLVHALTHRAGLLKAFLGIALLGAAAFGAAALQRDRQRTNKDGVPVDGEEPLVLGPLARRGPRNARAACHEQIPPAAAAATKSAMLARLYPSASAMRPCPIAANARVIPHDGHSWPVRAFTGHGGVSATRPDSMSSGVTLAATPSGTIAASASTVHDTPRIARAPGTRRT